MEPYKNKIVLNEENTEVCIEHLILSNPDTYNFLKDKDNLEDWVKKALIIGCVGLRQMVLTDNVDFVEKEFNKFIAKAKETFERQADNINDKIENTFSMNNTQSPLFQLKNIIEEYFDVKKGKFKGVMDEYFNKDKGQIKVIIDETFNIDNKKSALSKLIEELKSNSDMKEDEIQQLLNPHKTDSPAWQLKEQILDKLNDIREREFKTLSERITDLREKEIKDIRDHVLKESAISLEKQKGTSKGIDFEEQVYSLLQTLASPYENTISAVGEKTGTENKKGDILIELENKKKIIVECKDSSAYTSKKTLDEINDAIENRKASFGIFIFAKRDEMPKEICPIKITDKYLITYYDEDNVYFAYRIARLFALKEEIGSEDVVNLERVSSELKSLEENFRNFDTIQTKVTTIINSGEYVKTNLKNLRDNLIESLKKVKRALGEKCECDISSD